MAHASEDASDKALWITLAQSWLRLAEHVEHASTASYSIAAEQVTLATEAAE
jgi:hypothetical protein